ncbi:hypothetical protein GCM10023107_70790 [Actinoplanes octamycinicus]|nr:hypothetical protein Aoc01nite_27680 [Actinoplanes octamycinicus]
MRHAAAACYSVSGPDGSAAGACEPHPAAVARAASTAVTATILDMRALLLPRDGPALYDISAAHGDPSDLAGRCDRVRWFARHLEMPDPETEPD